MAFFEDSSHNDPETNEDLGPVAHQTTQVAAPAVGAEAKKADRKKKKKPVASKTKVKTASKSKEQQQMGSSGPDSDVSEEEANLIEQEEADEEKRLNNLPYLQLLDLIEKMILTFSRFHDISAQLASKADKKKVYGPLADDFSECLNKLTVFRARDPDEGDLEKPKSKKAVE
jgi:hypothetical protein